jgi:PAS domain S-box-containing protein
LVLLSPAFPASSIANKLTRGALQASEEEFRHVAGNIQEVFWMMDARTKTALYVNESYKAITGRTSKSFMEDPSSCLGLIHPDDRPDVAKKFDDAIHNGRFDERLRIIKPDGEIRWVWVRGFPDRDSEGNLKRLVGTALDITAQKQAEEQVAANLAMAKSAWAEEEALRKATLSLTQDLHMDKVMATLLRSLADVVPYSCARVIVPEGGPHWLALGERALPESPQPSPRVPWTFVDDKCGLIRRIAKEKKSVLISDTRLESDWPTFKGHKHLRYSADDVGALVGKGRLKILDPFVTNRSFEEFCAKHGDQINLSLVDAATVKWLSEEYGVDNTYLTQSRVLKNML